MVSRDADLMVRALAAIMADTKAALPLVAAAEEAGRSILKGTSYDGGGRGGGSYADPTAAAALSMKRERSRSLRTEAKGKVVQASQLLAEAKAALERAAG